MVKDIKGVLRLKCSRSECDCQEYMKEKDYNLCSYCDHPPVAHAPSHGNTKMSMHSDMPPQRAESNDTINNDNDNSFNSCASSSKMSDYERSMTSQHPTSMSLQSRPTLAQPAVCPSLPDLSMQVFEDDNGSDGYGDDGVEDDDTGVSVAKCDDDEDIELSSGRNPGTSTPNDKGISLQWKQVQSNAVRKRAAPSDSSPSPSCVIDTVTGNTLKLTSKELESMLDSCVDGKTVLAAHAKGPLTYSERNKLAAIAVNHAIQAKGLSDRPTNEDMQVLAEAIVGLFPDEKLSTWYYPAKSVAHRRISGGKLPERLRNVWRNLRGLLGNKSQTTVSPKVMAGETEEEVTDDLNWLKFNSQPWTEVTQRWSRTSMYRVCAFQEATKSLASFKLLFDAKSDQLINIDFDTLCKRNMYGECGNKLFQVWPLIAPKILSIYTATKKTIEWKDDPPEVQAVVAMIRLSCAKHRVRHPAAPRKTFVPTLSDSKDSFLMHAKTLDEADQHIEQIRNRYRPLGLTLQPLVVQIGMDTAVVIYDSNRWCFDNAIKAIDVCFKLIQVLHLEYNAASRPAWLFIQKYIYGISTQFDQYSSVCESLATELQL